MIYGRFGRYGITTSITGKGYDIKDRDRGLWDWLQGFERLLPSEWRSLDASIAVSPV